MNNQPDQYAGIILAAGASSRFGSIKILQEWSGEPLLRFLSVRMLESGLSPVVVVLGAYIDTPLAILQDLPVICTINQDWESGMTSSLQTGILALPDVKGVVMTLGDHPYLPKRLIHHLLGRITGKEDVIIPRFQGEGGHPVVWLKHSFTTITQLIATQKPRDAHASLRIQYVNWQDGYILDDIDTLHDYERVRNMTEFHIANNA